MAGLARLEKEGRFTVTAAGDRRGDGGLKEALRDPATGAGSGMAGPLRDCELPRDRGRAGDEGFE